MLKVRDGFWKFLFAIVFGAIAAFLILAPFRAHAGELNLALDGGGYTIAGPNGVTVIAPLGSARPQIIQVPRDLSADAEAHAHAWESFCQPTPVVGRYGVTYLHYAHEGCEFGRTQ